MDTDRTDRTQMEKQQYSRLELTRPQIAIPPRAGLCFIICVLLSHLCPSVSKGANRPAPVWSVAFSPDGATLAAGSYRSIQLWSVASKTAAKALAGHAGPVRCLAWSADGKRLAGGGGRPGEQGE